MKLLALDTATEACSVALHLDGRLITREQEFERGHAEHILPMVDEVLAEAGLELRALDALAVGRGPGGFTGVRLAVSVAQGLAFGAGLRVVPVSDLRAVAQRALDLEPSLAHVLACNDARMQEVYWAPFDRGPEGLAQASGPERVSPPSEVTLPAHWHQEGSRIGAAGRGLRAHPSIRGLLPRHAVVLGHLLPRAAEIARLALPEVQAGRTVPAEEAMPVYLRDNVAHPQTGQDTEPSRK
jgi:tRNA threonylcarbamoyladenosine biosynthesis protein TsaB